MARVHHVAKRRVGKRGEYVLRCTRCGQPIEYGQPYKWFKMKQARGGIKKSYHPDCEIKMADRSTSRLVPIWEAQQAFDTGSCDTVDELRAALEELAQVVRDVEQEYRESVENMEAGFGHRTYQADELEERAEALEGWADELEEWEPSDSEAPEQEEGQTDEEHEEAVDAWLDEIRGEADGLASECPV